MICNFKKLLLYNKVIIMTWLIVELDDARLDALVELLLAFGIPERDVILSDVAPEGMEDVNEPCGEPAIM